MTTSKDRPDMGTVEVITSVQRRRRWTAEEKRAILEEADQLGSSVSAVGRKYGINPNQLFTWRRLMREGGLVAVASEDAVVPASEAKQLKARIRDLERLLGKKTMEAEILREAFEIAREKKLLSRMPLSRRGGSL
jgi:transposase